MADTVKSMSSKPGWYRDPKHKHRWRYYDGLVWTDHTHRPPQKWLRIPLAVVVFVAVVFAVVVGIKAGQGPNPQTSTTSTPSSTTPGSVPLVATDLPSGAPALVGHSFHAVAHFDGPTGQVNIDATVDPTAGNGTITTTKNGHTSVILAANKHLYLAVTPKLASHLKAGIRYVELPNTYVKDANGLLPLDAATLFAQVSVPDAQGTEHQMLLQATLPGSATGTETHNGVLWNRYGLSIPGVTDATPPLVAASWAVDTQGRLRSLMVTLTGTSGTAHMTLAFDKLDQAIPPAPVPPAAERVLGSTLPAAVQAIVASGGY